MLTRSLTTLLVLLVSAEVPAQTQQSHVPRQKREVNLTGGPGETTAINGTANMPVTLIFDLPPRAAEVHLPGAEVRSHPFILNSLVVTPSEALVRTGSVPFTVPLADGSAVPLMLSFVAEQADDQVRLLRRPAPVPGNQGVEALPREAVLTAIGLYARAVLGPPKTSRCLPVRGVQPVEPFKNGEDILACSIEEMLFVRVKTNCQAATARLLAGSSERVEAVWVESGCGNGKCLTLLALRAPPPAVVAGLVLELRDRGGAACLSMPLAPDQPSATEAQRP